MSLLPTHIIPQPVTIRRRDGDCSLGSDTPITAPPAASAVAASLVDLLRRRQSSNPSGESSTIATETPGIHLRLESNLPLLGREGYRLEIEPHGVTMLANTTAGLFYAAQTLRQLLPAELEQAASGDLAPMNVPCVAIEDYPRFAWRGMHLDVGRHTYPLEFIKRCIDLLALHKLNVFHWHLTEDQGWRIEIKRYPNLTAIGSRRKATPVLGNARETDGKPYGGYYTQEQIAQLVQYAQERFVTVVPEIEMPGHSLAALASYPELGCRGAGYEVWTQWGICHEVYCAGNPRVYEFLDGLLEEVLALFPSDFIHIGGDECPKERWNACPKCQSMIQRQRLCDANELQTYFIRRIADGIRAAGRRIIGWDEILSEGLPSDCGVMCWRNPEYGYRAAMAAHDVVMSPVRHCYFDYYQSADRATEPVAADGCISLADAYGFDPVPAGLPEDKIQHILGAQGNVWTEFIPTEKQVEYQAFPRVCALAEATWSPPSARSFAGFAERLRTLLKRLKVMGVNYREPNGWEIAI